MSESRKRALTLLVLGAFPAWTSLKGGGAVVGLWLFLALALLLGIPLSLGWTLVTRAGPRSADAKIGDFADLKDAGLSDER